MHEKAFPAWRMHYQDSLSAHGQRPARCIELWPAVKIAHLYLPTIKKLRIVLMIVIPVDGRDRWICVSWQVRS
jgi:hypothetical protein